jgi:hypothetical protein
VIGGLSDWISFALESKSRDEIGALDRIRVDVKLKQKRSLPA